MPLAVFRSRIRSGMRAAALRPPLSRLANGPNGLFRDPALGIGAADPVAVDRMARTFPLTHGCRS